MNSSMLITRGVRNGLATALYILGVVSMMFNAERFSIPEPNLLIPVFMLLLFVVSALVTGGLVLWQPLKMLINGQKSEAGIQLLVTGATLAVCIVIVGLVLVLSS